MTADELRRRNGLLDGELLEAAAAVDPGHLHFAPEGEWSPAQVLAHLGEFPRFFAAELTRWRADPGAVIGRTHEHPARLAAVADPSGQRDELVAAAREAMAVLAEALEPLTDADIEATTQNVKYGSEPLAAFLDRYVVDHKAGHLDQIRALQKAAAEQ
ncbi:MAG TPA: DinB family protein [Acidimicrobiia bacterium]|nr:DinB family protein [Acidimicrobiia bacterium]